MNTTMNTPPDPSGAIVSPWQLAHVLSEQLDVAAPLNMGRRWIPMAERLWSRLHPERSVTVDEREALIATIRVPIRWAADGAVLETMLDADAAGEVADAIIAAGHLDRRPWPNRDVGLDVVALEVWAHASASLCGTPTCIYADGDRDADYENNCPHCKVAANQIATAVVMALFGEVSA